MLKFEKCPYCNDQNPSQVKALGFWVIHCPCMKGWMVFARMRVIAIIKYNIMARVQRDVLNSRKAGRD